MRVDAHSTKVHNCSRADLPSDDGKGESNASDNEEEDDEKTDTYIEEDIFEDDVVCICLQFSLLPGSSWSLL